MKATLFYALEPFLVDTVGFGRQLVWLVDATWRGTGISHGSEEEVHGRGGSGEESEAHGRIGDRWTWWEKRRWRWWGRIGAGEQQEGIFSSARWQTQAHRLIFKCILWGKHTGAEIIKPWWHTVLIKHKVYAVLGLHSHFTTAKRWMFFIFSNDISQNIKIAYFKS